MAADDRAVRVAVRADVDDVAALAAARRRGRAVDADWGTLGVDLLRALADRARRRGAVLAVVVSGRHDDAKRRALAAAGLSVASEWWVAPIDEF